MLKENRLTVQFARGSRPREPFPTQDRIHPRPRRTAFRMQLTGLAEGTSWQVSSYFPCSLVLGPLANSARSFCFPLICFVDS